MSLILEKIKKKIFCRFCMDLYYKAIVWVIFWRKLKKNFAFLYGLILQGYNMGPILEKIKTTIFLRVCMDL
jgi:hypothetical protein